jgi:hypothetical protein
MTTTETLNLYVVARGDEAKPGETAAYVTAAVDETAARRDGETASGDQPAFIWFVTETSVTLIGRADPQIDAGIVIADYHAG